MADRTVRAIFEARVTGAQKGIRDFARDVAGAGKKVDDLTKDLKNLDGQKVRPEIDVKIADAKKRLSDLTANLADLKKMKATPEVEADIERARKRISEVRSEIKSLTSQKAEVRVDASIKDAQKRLSQITNELGELRTLESTPEVDADIKAAQRKMRDVKAELRDLNAAKAEMKVTADTRPAEKAIDDLAGDIGDAGKDAGDEAGGNIAQGIISALGTIPIAGAIVGVGAAIAGGILLGIKQGLSIEAERDLFSAQTGLDEATANRFGRAAGEAYANAWGESVAANLDTARKAMQAGIIDQDATDAEIENVIAKLTGITDLFDQDISMAVQGVGNLMKTGLVRDANQAFDLIVAAQQKLPSDDLLETLNEYSNQFATMGISGQQAFGLIVQGAKAGARDTDKVADTIKEMGLRIREGTKPATDALKLLGLDAKQIVKDFQRGGPDATRAIGKVFDALRELEKKGGNTQAVIAALFGGPGEDLGAALYALDINKVDAALGGVEGSAGAADKALKTMTDNTATKIEEARRNVEVAMDGIKGALAEAFGDEIAGAAEWVSRNRAPLMEFFLDVIRGTFDMGRGFLGFSATAQEAIADVIVGIADLIDSLPGDQSELKESLYGIADGLRDGAKTIREEFMPELDAAERKVEAWAGPEIMKARVHDATLRMNEDFDGFVTKVGSGDLKVKINGDSMNAEEVLKTLTEHIDGTDGTVTINGEKVPAEDALDEVLRLVNEGKGEIKIGGDTKPAYDDVEGFKGRVSRTEASLYVTADVSPAEAALRALRARYAALGIRVAGVTGSGGLTSGTFHGGWTGQRVPGKLAGGWVPGVRAGYDNIVWPLHSGGQVLGQPLEGKEFVVNSQASAIWGPVLEWINAGGRPTSMSNDNRTVFERLIVQANDPNDLERKLRRQVARANNRSAS